MTNPNIPQNPNQNQAQQDNIFAAAYHGIIRNIAQARMNRAANVMERMDHKEALYSDLGHVALTGEERVVIIPQNVPSIPNFMAQTTGPNGRMPRMRANEADLRRGEFVASATASGIPARPRTFGERWMERRIDKRALKKDIAKIYDRRNSKIYGTNDVSQLEGSTKWDKRARIARVTADKYRGNLSPAEARAERNAIGAERPKLGQQSVKWSNNQVHKTDRKLHRGADQPILSRWRSRRHRRAVNRIQSSYYRIQRHTR